MTKVDRNIVEQEVAQMFDEHKTAQGVVEALLIEAGWDANAIRAAQEARQKKQEAVAERQEKKKENKESPQKLIQRLALEQKAEQSEDHKSGRGSRRELPLVIVSDDETETEKEEIEESDERSKHEEIETMSEVNAAQKQQSAADELKALADKFLESQGVATTSEDVKKADVLPPSTNILIGVPCFGGNIQYKVANLLMSLSSALSKAEIPHETHFVAGESLIVRARNYLASVAAFGRDKAGRPFSHLMFIDADVSFHPEYFFKMLKADLPIVALPYSLKLLNWKCIAEAAKRVTPESLPFFAGNPVIVADSGFAIDDKPVPVRAAGTGIMLVNTEVFRALASAYPERKYRPRPSQSLRPDWNFDFFRPKILNEEFLGEDFAFCEESARLGFGTFLLPLAVTRHTGNYDFVMDMSAVASADAALPSCST